MCMCRQFALKKTDVAVCVAVSNGMVFSENVFRCRVVSGKEEFYRLTSLLCTLIT